MNSVDRKDKLREEQQAKRMRQPNSAEPTEVICCRIPRSSLEKLDIKARRMSITRSMLVSFAIEAYLSESEAFED